MKKMMLLMLTLLIWGTASMNAQVKIGGDPETGVTTGAVLELDGSAGSLLLPRVDALSTENPAAGMQVYLTTDNKVYTYNGSAWVADASETQVATQINANKQASVGSAATASTADKLSQARRIILTGDVIGQVSFDGSGEVIINTTNAIKTGAASIVIQPAEFSFTRLYDVAGDPGMLPATGTLNGPALTIVANGANPTYKWQWRKSPATDWADATDAQGTGFNTISFTPKYTVGVDNWGLYEYQCIVTATTGAAATSATAQVAVGCGAKTNATNGWLRFMCQNLGAAPIPASTSLDNIPVAIETGTANTVSDGSSDAKGWLFQWGRTTDGHQLRNSPDSIGQKDIAWGDPTGSNKFYIGSNNWNINSNVGVTPYDIINPCPQGWTVPSDHDIQRTLNGVGVVSGELTGVTNAWVANRYSGVAVKPKSSGITTLYWPLTSARNNVSGTIENAYVGTWTSASANSPGYAVNMKLMMSRNEYEFGWLSVAVGQSIRCVYE